LLKLPFEEVRNVFVGSSEYPAKDNKDYFLEMKLRLKNLFDITSLIALHKEEFSKVTREYIEEILESMENTIPLDDQVFNQIKALNVRQFSRSAWLNILELFPNLVQNVELNFL